MASLLDRIDQRVPHAVEVRHRLHQIPELGYEEHRTADLIRTELDTLGINHIDGVPGAPTATIALLGDAKKPCVALRADMDALPIVERTGLDYASTTRGKMHACGHDGHMSVLLATAAVLKERVDTLDCCVKLMFQPAEEGGGGGKVLCDAGVLDGTIGPVVRAIFGLHGWPGLPVGCVGSRPGPLLAATDLFDVTFKGLGCHGAFPHLGADPLVAAAEAIVNLQQFVSRDIDPTEPAVVTIGKIAGGTAANVIPDTCTINGTARTLTDPMRDLVRDAIERRCRLVAEAGRCSIEFTWKPGYPPTINDERATQFVRDIATDVLGANRYLPAARPAMGGEDFAFYLERVPGCFFMLGVQPDPATPYPSLHSDHYDFTDAAIPVGVRMFCEIVERWSPDVVSAAT